MEWCAEEEVGVSCPSCWAVLGRSVSCNLKWLKSCTLYYLFDLVRYNFSNFFHWRTEPHTWLWSGQLNPKPWKANALCIWFIHWQSLSSSDFQTSDHSEKSSLQCSTHTHTHFYTYKQKSKKTTCFYCVWRMLSFSVLFCFGFFFLIRCTPPSRFVAERMMNTKNCFGFWILFT